MCVGASLSISFLRISDQNQSSELSFVKIDRILKRVKARDLGEIDFR